MDRDDPYAGLRLRRNPEARALVDRCLLLVTAVLTSDPSEAAVLEAEAEAIRNELALRFGALRSVRKQ